MGPAGKRLGPKWNVALKLVSCVHHLETYVERTLSFVHYCELFVGQCSVDCLFCGTKESHRGILQNQQKCVVELMI